MNRTCSMVVVLLLAGASLGWSQNSAIAPSPAPAGHGAFPVKTTKTLDSSKLKEGDAVELETSGSFKLPDGTVVPKGSKLAGHITAAKARSKGDSSSELAMAFDKLSVADGKQLAVKGTVQAVFPPVEDAAPQMAGKASGAGGGGEGANVGMVDTKSGSNMESSSKPGSPTDPKATGVHGIGGLELGTDGGLLSTGKSVKLGNGVRIIVHIDIFGS